MICECPASEMNSGVLRIRRSAVPASLSLVKRALQEPPVLRGPLPGMKVHLAMTAASE